MNSLFVSAAISAGLAITLLFYLVSVLATKNKPGRIFTGICASLLVMAGCVTYSIAMRYKAYGAFFDDSWRDPEVERHFMFDTKDTEELQAIFDSDPENFRFDLYDVILVRLGCEDCEKNESRILGAKAEIKEKKGRKAYIVFSRSDIGKRYAAMYGVDNVPSVIVDSVVIALY